MNEQEKQKKQAEKELLKFQKGFDKLMNKYPRVMLGSDVGDGGLIAYHAVDFNIKIWIS